MASDTTKPQSGNAGASARIGTAGESGKESPGGAGDRSGTTEGSQVDDSRREQGDTKGPRRRP